MYRRPYLPPPPADAAPPADASPPVPVITRHPLPPNGWAAIARFVAVVFLAATLGVTIARHAGEFWPGVGGLLAAAGVLLSIAAGVKLLWVGRTVRVPVLSAVAVLAALGASLHALNAGGTILLANFPLVVVLAVAVAVVPVAWWADGLTSAFDAKATAGLAGGLLLLAGVAALPLPSTTFRWLAALTLLANEALSLAVLHTYVGYVLADPALPLDTARAAERRWRAILCQRQPRAVSPFVQTGLVGLLALIVAFLPGDPAAPPDAPPAPDPTPPFEGGATYFPWLMAGTVLGFLFFVGFVSVIIRPAGRALAVWLLYPGDPLPGVYRPDGWLASVRVRRIALAAVLSLNVAVLRSAFARLDNVIAGVVAHADPFPAGVSDDVQWMRAHTYLWFAIALVLPLLWPVLTYLGHNVHVRLAHHHLDEDTAADSTHTPEGSP